MSCDGPGKWTAFEEEMLMGYGPCDIFCSELSSRIFVLTLLLFPAVTPHLFMVCCGGIAYCQFLHGLLMGGVYRGSDRYWTLDGICS